MLLAIVITSLSWSQGAALAQPSENQGAECPIDPGKVMVVATHPTEIIIHVDSKDSQQGSF